VDAEKDNHFVANITKSVEVEAVIEKVKPDYVFHLAALIDRDRSFSGLDKMMSVNVKGTAVLLEALKDVDYKQFVFVSSSEVYGNVESPFSENMVPKPVSPYSLSKLMAEHLVGTFSDLNQKPYAIARVFNFFGPGMPEQFFIPELINTLKKGETFKMTKGEQKRDFLYVEDVVTALCEMALSEKANKQLVNVCSGEGTSIASLALTAKEAMQSEAEIQMGAIDYRPNEVWEMIGDRKKLDEVTGFKPKYSLLAAMKMLMR